MIKPFSILDTRTKEWQDRKRYWIQTYNIQSELGREDADSRARFWEDNTISIFDATLCEHMYQWFIPKEGKILDPFAGGSVRGIVATEMGYEYMGIDLSKQQIEENRNQSDKPKWLSGDSDDMLDYLVDEQFDFVRPAKVSLMVLADRGERELPVSADFASQTVILPESQILVLERNQINQFSFVIEERI